LKFLRLPKAFADPKMGPDQTSVYVDPDAVTLIVPDGPATCLVYCSGTDFARIQGTSSEVAEIIGRSAGPEPLPGLDTSLPG
jgi:hypothetical protein